jgi:hypothetical protein
LILRAARGGPLFDLRAINVEVHLHRRWRGATKLPKQLEPLHRPRILVVGMVAP